MSATDVQDQIRSEVCDYAGHDFEESGVFGLLICVNCGQEKEADE